MEATPDILKGHQLWRQPAAGQGVHSGDGGAQGVASAFQLARLHGAPIVGPGRVHSQVRTAASFPYAWAQIGEKGSRL